MGKLVHEPMNEKEMYFWFILQFMKWMTQGISPFIVSTIIYDYIGFFVISFVYHLSFSTCKYIAIYIAIPTSKGKDLVSDNQYEQNPEYHDYDLIPSENESNYMFCQKIICIHEAGHTVMAYLCNILPFHVDINKASISYENQNLLTEDGLKNTS